MKYQTGKLSSKRYRPTYLYSIISITMVLYMLGLLGMIVLHARALSDYFKEHIEVSVVLKDNAKEADILRLQKILDTRPFVKETRFVSKDEAAEQLKSDFEEDFIDLLGYNPLYASIVMHLKSGYANTDSLQVIETKITAYNEVQELYYERSLVHLINKNVRTIGIVLVALSIVLFMIALTLINNTIRLSMYSNRFLIKSMQLVGATRRFIIWPFIKKGLINGMVSGLIAIAALAGTLYYAQYKLPELKLLADLPGLAILSVAIIFTGLLISWWSTRITVRKYLRMKLDELY